MSERDPASQRTSERVCHCLEQAVPAVHVGNECRSDAWQSASDRHQGHSVLVGMVRSIRRIGCARPAQSAALDHGQSSARLASPRRTGLPWMYATNWCAVLRIIDVSVLPGSHLPEMAVRPVRVRQRELIQERREMRLQPSDRLLANGTLDVSQHPLGLICRQPRPDQQMHVFRHDHPSPNIKTVLLPRRPKRLDEPQPATVLAQQGHATVARKSEKMGVPRLIAVPDLFTSPLALVRNRHAHVISLRAQKNKPDLVGTLAAGDSTACSKQWHTHRRGSQRQCHPAAKVSGRLLTPDRRAGIIAWSWTCFPPA